MPHIATQQTSTGKLDAVAATTTADQFDQITARLDQLRGDLYRAVRALPDRALPAVFALAVATDHLRAAAVALDQAADRIEAIEADRGDVADGAWADPEWASRQHHPHMLRSHTHLPTPDIAAI